VCGNVALDASIEMAERKASKEFRKATTVIIITLKQDVFRRKLLKENLSSVLRLA